MLLKARPISHCHHCFRQLMWKPGGGEFSYAEVIHPDGYRVRVHKDCQMLILGDGYKLPPEQESTRGR